MLCDLIPRQKILPLCIQEVIPLFDPDKAVKTEGTTKQRVGQEKLEEFDPDEAVKMESHSGPPPEI